jgi:hypothetical protein
VGKEGKGKGMKEGEKGERRGEEGRGGEGRGEEGRLLCLDPLAPFRQLAHCTYMLMYSLYMLHVSRLVLITVTLF